MDLENDFTRSSRPFTQVVMCCTGTSISGDARAELAKQVVEMGAIWKQDLTSEATHMLVGESSTKKYKYVAKQRPDVKVVTVEFVEAARILWLNGEDIVMDDLEQKYKLPTFHDFKICVTNLQEDDRNKIQVLTEQHGGTFHGDLTKSITHLVVAQTEGKKYQFARNWNIKCVSTEWFYESIERGMSLDEGHYDPETPLEQRGKGAWIRPNLGKRKAGDREASNAQPVVRRRIRRVASDRLGHQSENLWGDIVGQAQAPKPVERNEWDEPQALTRTKSMQIPEESIVEDSSCTLKPDVNHVNKARPTKDTAPQEKSTGIYANIGFYIHGFESKKSVILRGLIQSYNGECYPSLNALIGSQLSRLIIVVPETLRASDLPSTSDLSKAVHIVTYWWIEKCMHVGKFVDPDSHVLGKPFRKTGIKEFRDMTISISKFDGVDFLHVHKAIELLGATWYDKLSQKRSLLIVNSPYKGDKSEKVEAALEWGVPIVSVEWLFECVSDGERIPFTRYIIAGSAANKGSAKDSIRVPHDIVEKQQVEDMESQRKMSLDSRCLTDCVFYFGSSVQDLRDKYEPVIVSLGGTVSETLKRSSTVTHFVHVNLPADEKIPDVIAAQSLPNCHIITPAWLKNSHRLKKRANERDFLALPQSQSDIHEANLAEKQLAKENESIDISERPGSDTNDETQDFSAGPFLLDDDSHTKTNLSLVSMVAKSMNLPETESTTRSNSILQSFEGPQKSDTETVVVNTEKVVTTTTTTVARPMQPPTPEAIRTKTLEAIQEVKSFRQIINGQPRQAKSRGRLQGRAPSNPITIANNNNSASRTNSITSALSNLDYASDDDGEDSERKNTKLDETQFGNVEPSQVVVYDDPVAQEERRKLMEALQLKTEDKRMKGRVISASTSAVEEMGDPMQHKRRSTRRTNH